MRSAVVGLVAAGLVASAGGCGTSDPTEIVVVVESDIAVPDAVDTISVQYAVGDGLPLANQFPQGYEACISGLPLAFAFHPSPGVDVFGVSVELLKEEPPVGALLVAVRSLTGVRFVPGRQLMYSLSISGTCACQGTQCPNAQLPECGDVADPELGPYDAAQAPPIHATIDVVDPLAGAQRHTLVDAGVVTLPGG
jgi:hypothetical protein